MPAMKTNWVYYALIVLMVEKIFQHIFVTLAFYFNWGEIASTVAVSPSILMLSGALVAVLFVLGLRGLLAKKHWSVSLVTALALFDILGEFVAQGRTGIEITISLIVAWVLLLLALLY